MEISLILILLVRLLFVLFFTFLMFHAIKKICILMRQGAIRNKRQKNASLDNMITKKRKRATLTKVPRMMLDKYFEEEFYKFSSEFCRIKSDDCDKFGEYVTLQLKSLKSENNKKRLASEIRKIIQRIAGEDTNSLSSNIFAKAPTPNFVVK